MTTQRAQELIDASMQFTLRPRRGDREKFIAFILREASDILCTYVGELQDPIMVLREFADEFYKVNEDT